MKHVRKAGARLADGKIDASSLSATDLVYPRCCLQKQSEIALKATFFVFFLIPKTRS
jgi:hypothetical protein